jgi:hypothetical protein
MNENIKNIIHKLKIELKEDIEMADYHGRKLKEYEKKIIDIKNGLNELENLK